MTPTQRAAAERLAPMLADIANARAPSAAGFAVAEAADLLRELLAEPVVNQQGTTEPVQEPAAWGVFVDDELFKPFNCKDEAVDWFQAQYNHGSRYDYLVLPLFAAPQQRRPLTDKQISNRLWESDWPEVLLSDFVRAKLRVFARAIERAHGITGEPT